MKVLFLCPYGGAKSVLAATFFNEIAGNQFEAVAAAAEEPYEAVPQKVAEFLAGEGHDVKGFKPRRVDPSDFNGAARVISIDCDLSNVDACGKTIERWDDVPKVSDSLPDSVAAIRRHVKELADELLR
jgi:protein-tyrosine-phosphatase